MISLGNNFFAREGKGVHMYVLLPSLLVVHFCASQLARPLKTEPFGFVHYETDVDWII